MEKKTGISGGVILVLILAINTALNLNVGFKWAIDIVGIGLLVFALGQQNWFGKKH